MPQGFHTDQTGNGDPPQIGQSISFAEGVPHGQGGIGRMSRLYDHPPPNTKRATQHFRRVSPPSRLVGCFSSPAISGRRAQPLCIARSQREQRVCGEAYSKSSRQTGRNALGPPIVEKAEAIAIQPSLQ